MRTSAWAPAGDLGEHCRDASATMRLLLLTVTLLANCARASLTLTLAAAAAGAPLVRDAHATAVDRRAVRPSSRGGAAAEAAAAGLRSCRARCAADTRLVAYAPVGRSGDFGRRPSGDDAAQGGDNPVETWVLACGLGWLYGLGCVVGPFFGVGVGLVFPTGVIAGAGAGVGVVIGIGMGGGGVWGSGRGAVQGFKVGVPMAPPKVPEARELAARARATVDALSNARGLARTRLRAAMAARRGSRAADELSPSP